MDLLNKYVTNPVVKLGSFFSNKAYKPQDKVVETIIKHEYQPLEPFSYSQLPRVSRIFMKFSALAGLSAVAMSAYGSHVFNKSDGATKELRDLYFTAQYYHLVHSVALLSLPLVKRPKLTGTLWITGLALFCGTMYYHALKNDGRFRYLTPYGGFCLIGGWLTILI